MNSRDQTSAMSGTVTGAYTVGADNNGLMTTNAVVTTGGTGSQTSKFAIALTDAIKTAQQFRMVEIDDTGSSPSGQHATGNCYLDTTANFAASTISSTAGSWGSATYGTFSVINSDSTKGGLSCAVINATINSTKFACTMLSDSSPSVMIFQQ